MGPSPESDADLVRRARAGAEPALRALIERHQPTVRAHIERRMPAGLKRKLAAEDLAQEVWLVAATRLAEFEDRGDGAFLAWVLGIADFKLRAAIRAYLGTRKRAAVREVSRGARPDTSMFAADTPRPSEVAQARELSDAATRAMAALPEDYREILRLVQVEGLSLQAAAERLGRSHAAVKKLHARALAKLAEMLGSTGET